MVVVDVVGLPEFLRCVGSAAKTHSDSRDIDLFLRRLSMKHSAAQMRKSRLQIPGTDIELWATHKIRLSGGLYRVTWRYEERDDARVLVCFTLAQV